MRTFNFILKKVAIYLLVLGLGCFIIVGCKHPNEQESATAVSNLFTEKYDYCIEDYQNNIFVFHAEKWKITTGNKDHGFYYDEREQSQYKDGRIISLTKTEMAIYDQVASHYLEVLRDIVEAHEYIAYSDARFEYMDQYYYFTLTENGLARFEEVFSSGRIVFLYREGKVTELYVQLFQEKQERPVMLLTFGKIAFEKTIGGSTRSN